MTTLSTVFTSCKRNPLNKIFSFEKRKRDYAYIVPWYIIHFNQVTINYIGYNYHKDGTGIQSLVSPQKASLYKNERPICLFSCIPGKFFHIMSSTVDILRLILIDSIEDFHTSDISDPIWLNENLTPWINNTYNKLHLNIDKELYRQYIVNNLDKIKSLYSLTVIK